MGPKRNIRRISANTAAILGAVLLGLILICGVTYTWLSGYWDSKKTNVGFTAGDVEQPVFHMWMFDTDQEDNTKGAPGAWVERTVTREDEFQIIPNAGDAVAGTFAAKDIHLGTVDNLVTPKEDNTLYFRLDAKQETGTTYSLTVQKPAATDAFSIYQQTDTAGAYTLLKAADYPDLYGKLLTDNNDHYMEKLLQVTYATSTDPREPGTPTFETLTFSQTLPALDQNAQMNYIYIKISPDLNTIADITKYLNPYMPCVILFDLKFTYQFPAPPA